MPWQKAERVARHIGEYSPAARVSAQQRAAGGGDLSLRGAEDTRVEGGKLAGIRAVEHNALHDAGRGAGRRLAATHRARKSLASLFGARASQASVMSSVSSRAPMRSSSNRTAE